MLEEKDKVAFGLYVLELLKFGLTENFIFLLLLWPFSFLNLSKCFNGLTCVSHVVAI